MLVEERQGIRGKTVRGFWPGCQESNRGVAAQHLCPVCTLTTLLSGYTNFLRHIADNKINHMNIWHLNSASNIDFFQLFSVKRFVGVEGNTF